MKNHPIEHTRIDLRFGSGRAAVMGSGRRKPSRAITLISLGIAGASMATGGKLHAATTQTVNLSANESITISAGNSLDITNGHGILANGVPVGNVEIASDGAIRVNTSNDSNVDAAGAGFKSETSGTAGSTARVVNFANEGAITATVAAEDSYAYALGVDFLALAKKSGDANLRAEKVVNGKNATITAGGNGDSALGMAFTSTALGQGAATLDAGGVINQGGRITAGGNALDVKGISIFGRTEGQGKSTLRVDALTNEGAITVNGNTTAKKGTTATGIEVVGKSTGSGDAYARVGRIVNAQGSTISANGKKSESIRGVSLQSVATGAGNAHVEIGQFTNSGAITATSESTADPIAMEFHSKSAGKGNATLHITGNITNEASGVVSSAKSAIRFDTKSGNTTGDSRIIVDGALINQGLIQSTGEDAIYVGLNTKITGGIINTGVIQGKTSAIYVENDDSTIVPAITISGDSARVIGVIDAPNSVLTLRGQSQGKHFTQPKNFFAPEGDIYVTDFIIHATGVMGITNDSYHQEVGNLFQNQGILWIPAGKAPKITGNYAQTGKGVYIAGVDANGQTIKHGTLQVTGDVNLNNKLRVNITKGAVGILGANQGKTTIGSVLTYGGGANANAIHVASNNLLVDFSAVDNKSGSIELGATVMDSYTQALLLSRNTRGGSNVLDIAAALGGVLDAAAGGGFSDDLQDVVDRLGNLYAPERVKALEEIKTTSTATVSSGVAIQAGNSFGRVTQNRIAALTRPDHMTTGLAAGDPVGEEISWWLQPYVGTGSQDDKGGIAGYDMDTRGFVLGFDGAISPGWRAGLAASYTNTDIDANTGNQSVDIDTYQIGAYGTRELASDIRLNAQAGVGWFQYDSRRDIPSMDRVTKASYDGTNLRGSLSLEKDYRISADAMAHANLSMEYNHVEVDGYAENGAGALDLKVPDTDQDSLILGIGGEYRHALSEKGILGLRGMVGYDALVDQSSVRTQLVAGGAAFTTPGMKPERFLLRGGIGYEFRVKDDITIDVGYDAELRRGFDNHAVSAKFKYLY
uniref:Outer membrane autotransporter barrel domain-containing protein n=1 Tax=Candidatus Kentrum sp. SD TaxID=2126332 RepID=A0A450YKH1_9GAMM|nr:MAG: outer membrane autotransporter barrel domain-containing protein [Candidatus Kentron sp. SD]VFK42006.1 MAG: outer membrane autotransporter barrel domain-containing protein [Candidatus Kentron sp. SD]